MKSRAARLASVSRAGFPERFEWIGARAMSISISKDDGFDGARACEEPLQNRARETRSELVARVAGFSRERAR